VRPNSWPTLGGRLLIYPLLPRPCHMQHPCPPRTSYYSHIQTSDPHPARTHTFSPRTPSPLLANSTPPHTQSTPGRIPLVPQHTLTHSPVALPAQSPCPSLPLPPGCLHHAVCRHGCGLVTHCGPLPRACPNRVTKAGVHRILVAARVCASCCKKLRCCDRLQGINSWFFASKTGYCSCGLHPLPWKLWWQKQG